MSKKRENALKFKWRIENVESWLQKRDDTLYSSQFIAEELAKTRWKLGLSQNWQLAEKYVSLFLQRDVDNGGPQLIEVNYELSFLAGDGSPLASISFAKKFAPLTASNELKVKQVEILLTEKKAFLPNGVLTVFCKLSSNCFGLSKEHSPSIDYTLQSVIGTKRITLKAAIENFHPSSSAVVNFLPHSVDISLISLEVFVSFDSEKGTNEFVFNKRHVECKSVCWYSIKLFALDSEGHSRKVRESLNLTKNSYVVGPMHRDQRLIHDSIFSYCLKNILNLKLVVYYHPGIVLESAGNWFGNCKNLPCRPTYTEITKVSDVKGTPFRISNCLSSTELGIEEEECLDPVETSYLPLTTPKDYLTSFYNDRLLCDANLQADSETLLSHSKILTARKNYPAPKGYLPLTTFKDDLTSLYKDRLFCDTNLRVDGETFPAHRSVLSARSPVFRKMFTAHTRKKPAGEGIQISGISPDTARRMLQFLYTDFTGDLDMQSAKDLYFAADTYEITSLKARCSTFMKKNLHSSNVCDVLVLARKHRDNELESSAQEFVLNNDDEVIYSDEFRVFMKNYSRLAAQVMCLEFTKI